MSSSNPNAVLIQRQVVVHPLVLLSVVDHFNRMKCDKSKRVVGILLGEYTGNKVDVTNSYAGGVDILVLFSVCCLFVVCCLLFVV